MSAITCLFAVVVAFAAEGEGTVHDETITARIETMFQLNEHLSPFDIQTVTRNSNVTLTGSVNDTIQKQLASDLAASVDGVERVENRLMIVSTMPSAPSSTQREWRDVVRDKSIAASVRTRLLYHKQFRGIKIGVRCEKGVVTLSGLANSEQQRIRIGQITYETRGVEEVLNNIGVHPKRSLSGPSDVSEHMTDEWIETRVETAILLNRHVSIREVDVEVNDGVCILSGTVESPAQRKFAAAIAQNVRGVGIVQNDIYVSAPPNADLDAMEPSDDSVGEREVEQSWENEESLVTSTPLSP